MLCITQPIEKYSCTHELGFNLGIGEMLKSQPSMFALLSIMSPVFYQWEKGSPVPEEDRCHGLEAYLTKIYSDTLSASIGGLSVSQWLNMMETPTELYFNINQFSWTGLPLLDFYDVSQLRLVMKARCYSWLKYKKPANHSTMATLFTKQDEKEVKANAYGKFRVS